jgi:hypothetical protein
LSGLAKSLPPIDELLKNAGMELPSMLQGAKAADVEDQPLKEVKEQKTKEEPKTKKPDNPENPKG